MGPNRTSTRYTVFGLAGDEGLEALGVSCVASCVGFLLASDLPDEEPLEPVLDFPDEELDAGEATVETLPGRGVKGSRDGPPRCTEAPLVTSASAACVF